MKTSTKVLSLILVFALAAVFAWSTGGKETGGAAVAAGGHESPMLADLVKAGKLPPLKERLPKEPLVIKTGMMLPKENSTLTIGKYGGTIRYADIDPAGGAETWSKNIQPLRNMPGVGMITTDVVPWFLKSYAVDSTGKVFTFVIREGVKWSDGVPVTSEDVKFWYEDVILNKELNPTVPLWLSPGGKPAELQVVDNYTFRLSFAQAYGSLLVRIGSFWFGNMEAGVFFYPKHYMKDYHIKYAKLDDLKLKLKAASLQDDQWALLFNKTFNYQAQGTIGLPSLAPWILKEHPSSGVSIFERNPYFWMVDEAGNQLPYIDYQRYEVVTDTQNVLTKIVTGDIDFSGRTAVGADMPILKENEKKGGYVVAPTSDYAERWIFYNYDNPDTAWAKIVQNPKFRIALSTALNRTEFLKIVYNNLASIPSWTPKYDPAKANQLLDEVGLSKRDADGWRLRPDGKRMEMLFEFPQVDIGWTKKCELAVENWKAVGIYSSFKILESGLWDARANANELYVTTAWGHPFQLAASEPLLVEEMLPWAPRWPTRWWQWYKTGGAQGVRPTMQEAFDVYKLLDAIRVESDPKKRIDLLNAIFKLYYDNELFLVDGEKAIDPTIYSAKLGNTSNGGSRHSALVAAPVYYFK